MELYDESPDYTPFGFADIWKGNRHGEPVCIRAIWTRDPLLLREIERVCGSLNLSEAYSVCPIPDVPSRCQWGHEHLTSERAPYYRGVRDAVSVLHHESVDAEREHHPVHQNALGCRPVDVGMSLSTQRSMTMTP